MENRIENFSGEKAVCHTYSSLVSEMASRMVVNEKKILPKEGEKFDYEDINSWVGAVDFMGGKVPDIEAHLSSKQGVERFVFAIQEVELVKGKDEIVGKEQILYSMALTEAKMKVIQDIAEETYPAVAFQIGDYRREMGKVRNEILELKQSGVSVNEVLERMMSRRMMLAASAVVIAGLLLSACGYSPTTEVPNSTATTGPQITETIPANGTPGTTETPFVEVTPGVEN